MVLMIGQVLAVEFLLAYNRHGELNFWLNPER